MILSVLTHNNTNVLTVVHYCLTQSFTVTEKYVYNRKKLGRGFALVFSDYKF